MKKLAILVAALMLATAPAFSQIIPGAGYLNSSYMSGGNAKALNGFYAGVTMDMNILGVKGLTFAPGAYASFVTSSSSGSFYGIISGSERINEIDLNIPAYFKFNFALSGSARVFAYAGPTAQLGVVARSNTTSDIAGFGGKSSRDLFGGNSGLNRFNILVGGGVGFGYSKFSINVGYDYGLLNSYRGSGNTMINRANLHVGIAYAL